MMRISHSSRCVNRVLLMAFALILVLGLTGCSKVPRKHWWQFWRKPAAVSNVYTADAATLPPPDVLDLTGQSPGEKLDELPSEPVTAVDMTEPTAIRQQAQPSGLQLVHFEYNSSALSAEAQAILDANAQWIMANPAKQIQLEGHCDERGTVEYNLNLGDRRAKAVKAYLVNRGVQASRLHTISYGEERPLAPGWTEEDWAQNRRAQFLVY